MPRLPSDEASDQLILAYRRAAIRTRALLAEAIDSGALGDAAYRARQLEALAAVLARLEAQSGPLAARAIRSAYRTGAELVDGHLGTAPPFADSINAAGRFAGVHEAAVARFYGELDSRIVAARRTLGRSVDDVFRRVGLQEVETGIAAGLARREVSSAIRDELVADGLTAFRDKAGRRWTLEHYSAMVARTTTREAVTQGLANRMLELGQDVVEISTHANPCPICIPFQGRRYSLTGDTAAYPKAEQLPPYHPNCIHVATPAPIFAPTTKQPAAPAQPSPPPAAPPAPPAAPAAPTPPRPSAPPRTAPEAPSGTSPTPPPGGGSPSIDPKAVTAGDRLEVGGSRRTYESSDAIAHVERQLELIDAVHAIPGNLGKIKVTVKNLRAGLRGSYGHSLRVTADERFEPHSETIDLSVSEIGLGADSLAHELGHALDRLELGDGVASGKKIDELRASTAAGILKTARKYASERAAPYAQWRAAISAAPTTARALAVDPRRSYVASWKELFARSYEQWIGLRSGDPELIEKCRPGPGNVRYWPADEFAPIAEAFDELFRSRGLLRD